MSRWIISKLYGKEQNVMDVRTRRDIQLVIDTMGYLAELENQDSMLVIECGQHMLADILSNDTLEPIETYIHRYCDVIDGPNDPHNAAYHATQILLHFAGS